MPYNENDPLNPARGIINGTLLCLGFWFGVALIVYGVAVYILPPLVNLLKGLS